MSLKVKNSGLKTISLSVKQMETIFKEMTFDQAKIGIFLTVSLTFMKF